MTIEKAEHPNKDYEHQHKRRLDYIMGNWKPSHHANESHAPGRWIIESNIRTWRRRVVRECRRSRRRGRIYPLQTGGGCRRHGRSIGHGRCWRRGASRAPPFLANSNQQHERHEQTKRTTPNEQLPPAQPKIRTVRLEARPANPNESTHENNQSRGHGAPACRHPANSQPPKAQRAAEKPPPQRRSTSARQEAERGTNLRRRPPDGREKTMEAAAHNKTGGKKSSSSRRRNNREQRGIGRGGPLAEGKRRKKETRAKRRQETARRKLTKPTRCPLEPTHEQRADDTYAKQTVRPQPRWQDGPNTRAESLRALRARGFCPDVEILGITVVH